MNDKLSKKSKEVFPLSDDDNIETNRVPDPGASTSGGGGVIKPGGKIEKNPNKKEG